MLFNIIARNIENDNKMLLLLYQLFENAKFHLAAFQLTSKPSI
jgi:hypothetical protein